LGVLGKTASGLRETCTNIFTQTAGEIALVCTYVLYVYEREGERKRERRKRDTA
jgi:hypothetical protein